jgi:hypothetical protein
MFRRALARPVVGPLAIVEGTSALVRCFDSFTVYLQTREKRAALETAARVESRRLKAEVAAVRLKLKRNIKYWKAQHQDNESARKHATRLARELMRSADRAVHLVDRISRAGQPVLAEKVVGHASHLITQAAAVIAQQFPAGPLAMLE